MPRVLRPLLTLVLLCTAAAAPAFGQGRGAVDTSYGDSLVHHYFDDQVRRIEAGWLADVGRLEDWQRARPRLQQALREMLGLDPLPPRTDLKATITGTVDHPAFTVEKLHFQSMPGLYVTANLYLPRQADGPLPGILYVCGHATLHADDGTPLGAKAAYQRHPAWYARHGYAVLIIDTVQLGEIDGVHHGTYRLDRWWWWNRGYTPAGVEAWNGMRALDYLAARPEVDAGRLAVTGRSGGGIYSWYLAALDDRVRTSVPTAGLTDLRDHVVDGVVGDHCDCMYPVNTRRWDYPLLAALAAPRPTLMANGDVDPLFPLDGVRRSFHKAAQVYALHGRLDDWELLVVPGAHEDTPALQRGTFAWMHRHLGGGAPAETDSAIALLEPEVLRVFDRLPEDAINDRIDEVFVPAAEVPEVPASWEAWEALRATWLGRLGAQTFAGWPETAAPAAPRAAAHAEAGGLRLTAYDFESQAGLPLRLWVAEDADVPPEAVTVAVVDADGWQRWLAVLQAAAGTSAAEELVGPGARATPWPAADADALARLRERLRTERCALAVVAPRGVGPTTWTETDYGYTVRRSFMLLGQTRDGMRVWDVRRAVQALRTLRGRPQMPLRLEAEGVTAGLALYASVFEPAVDEVALRALPATHRDGPILLNVRKVLDLPQALALALAPGRRVTLFGADEAAWRWPAQLARRAPEGAALLFAPAGDWVRTAALAAP